MRWVGIALLALGLLCCRAQFTFAQEEQPAGVKVGEVLTVVGFCESQEQIENVKKTFISGDAEAYWLLMKEEKSKCYDGRLLGFPALPMQVTASLGFFQGKHGCYQVIKLQSRSGQEAFTISREPPDKCGRQT